MRVLFSQLQYSSLECQHAEACVVVTVAVFFTTAVKFRQDIGFEVLTAVVKNNFYIFWDTRPYSTFDRQPTLKM
jgi:hypothetical protein